MTNLCLKPYRVPGLCSQHDLRAYFVMFNNESKVYLHTLTQVHTVLG